MDNALLKKNPASKAVDFQTRKVLTRSGLIAGLCLSTLAPSYALPAGLDAAKAQNESVTIIQQTKKVSGVVTDNTGEPILGANVVVKGTTEGTVTDMDGKYTLDVPNNATLSISFIGYTTKEVKVGNLSVINVVLEEEAIGLNEVVAIGYGYVKKKDLTGAVSTVSADDMVMGGTVMQHRLCKVRQPVCKYHKVQKPQVVQFLYVSVVTTQFPLPMSLCM